MLTFEPFKIWCLINKKGRNDVVDDTGISKPTVHKIFNDLFPFKTEVIEAICRTYNLKVEEVIKYKFNE